MLPKSFAGIQYAGIAGISRDCLEAIRRFIQYGDRITSVKILTASQTHCFLIELEGLDAVAVKSGFSSGYPGEGPRTFSEALSLFRSYGVEEIDEYIVSDAVLERLDRSALTTVDLDAITSSRPVRPMRWFDYIYEAGTQAKQGADVWSDFPPIIPWRLIDKRIIDLAVGFFEDPDARLLTGYRRLEGLVKARLKSEAQSHRIFAQAFQGEKSQLTWEKIEPSEHNGRAELFTGAYKAHRNPRAHQEIKRDDCAALSEFLVLNELYRLESLAVERPVEVE